MLRALIWNKGRPTEWALQVRKNLETLACQVSRHLTPEEMSRMAIKIRTGKQLCVSFSSGETC